MNVLRSFTFSVAFYANLLPLAFFKKLTIFLRKTNLFFQEGSNFSTFWGILRIQLQPTRISLFLAVFKGMTIFLEKPIYFIYQEQVLNVLRSLTFSVAVYGKFATCSNFEKIKNSLEKPIYSTLKHQIFEKFEVSYYFSRIVVQNC